mgnify:CR=1 FL=1
MLVLPFNRTESQAAASYALFGKLPNRPDFVRVNATHPVALEFDQLIQQACERQEPPGDGAEPVDFQYISQDQRHVMIGALMPSQDQAGRRYPLVAAAILPRESVENYLAVSPIAYEVFFDGLREQVVNAVDNSVEALSCRQFLESSLRSQDAAAEDLELAGSVVARFLETQPAHRMADLLAAGPCPAPLSQAVLNAGFYQAYLRRFDHRSTNQLILLPLSSHKGEQALMASTWLSILAALWSGAGIGQPWRGSYLLVRRPNIGAQLVATVGRIPDSFAAVLLGAPIEPAMLLDLGTENDAWKSHRMYAESAYALGRILADPDCRLAALCSFLGDMGRQLARNI